MKKFRFLTSGESHGKCLNAIIEGVPAGFKITEDDINKDLERRQSGYGRGKRMQIETDKCEIKSGVRLGKTTGAPICLEITNKDYENWKIPMNISDDDLKNKEILKIVAQKSFTTPRPGHADFAGSVKYQLEDLRDVLERSSARQTAIEVAVGSVAKQILREFSIIGFSHVIQIGKVKAEVIPQNYTLIKESAEHSELYCADDVANDVMKEAIDIAKSNGDTLGGKFEVIFGNLPIGLGSHVHWDRKIDGRIAQAVMSIPAVKSVEIGAGIKSAELLGSKMHDELFIADNKIYRKSNNAGGIEGGMTNGEPIVVRAAMKPVPTMKTPLRTVDLYTKEQAESHFERSDTCAVPACAVVAEARIAWILLDEFLEKFGGDSLNEIRKNYEE
ncbi:chorismate synthase [bacterium]|nr:chorismate synthase [bacterium]